MGDTLGKLFIEPSSLPAGGFGFVQVIFLAAVYAVVLFNASNLISDGSELLLLVPSLAGIVGSIVLPVLGAVPDGAIVLFSGLGPDAQEQLSVGVGALAGSTIMLLTLPWALSVYAGRVNIDSQGNGNYRRPKGASNKKWAKLSPPGNSNLFSTGVTVGSEIAINAKTMILTAMIYLVIQVPALFISGTRKADATKSDGKIAAFEMTYALVAFILCCIAFVGYLVWNARRSSQISDDALGEKRVEAIRNGSISLSGVMAEEVVRMAGRGGSQYGSTDLLKEETSRMKALLRPFFIKYDVNHDNQMDMNEVGLFFQDLNEKLTNDELEKWFKSADLDNSGFVDLDELVTATIQYVQAKYEEEVETGVQPGTSLSPKAAKDLDMMKFGGGDEDEEEEEEEIPEDLAHLSVDEQQRKIKIRSAYMMSLGTFIVLLFSDPMVAVLSEIGKRTGIPSFYISFIVAPLASNASELIASYNYALKKTSKTISISLAALLGAACMNNTLCLGIFMALMYFKPGGLAWKFSAETISILVVEIAVGLFALKKTQRLVDAAVVLSLFPLSIVLVYLLENVFGLD